MDELWRMMENPQLGLFAMFDGVHDPTEPSARSFSISSVVNVMLEMSSVHSFLSPGCPLGWERWTQRGAQPLATVNGLGDASSGDGAIWGRDFLFVIACPPAPAASLKSRGA